MRTYLIQPGDTFASVARKTYGAESEARLIASANPGITEPLYTGFTLIIPDRPEDTKPAPQAPARTPNEAAILIESRRFRFWDSIRITRSLDSVDTMTFSGPFEPDAPGFRETFKPFTYKPVEVLVGGARLFTGTMVDVAPSVTAEGRVFSVSCYSVPGVLMDCSAPASAYPVEYDYATLKTIAADLVRPFGIPVEFAAPAGAVFERVALAPGQRIYDFLTDLAQQRGLVISTTPAGALLFRKSVSPGAPVAILTEGQSPLLAVVPTFSPQSYYSHLTGLEPVIVGLDGAQYTVKNDRLRGVLRPTTFTLPDTFGADTAEACRAKAARMFGAMASYRVEVATWRDPGGRLWEPNTTIQVAAPSAMIYGPYEFLIRSVDFNSDTQSATLELVMPGAYAGQQPEALPWD